MIWRDDDISISTDLAVLKPVHDIFKKHIVLHTVAVIAEDIGLNVELVEYLKRENFNVQLHCWKHYNLVENIDKLKTDIGKALETFENCGFERPTTLYPPWNITNNAVNCLLWDEFKLKVSNQKCSLSYYVAKNGNVGVDVVNFHYWDGECKDLDEALKIYNARR